MSRTMPSECPHGYIYDWGDFGCDDCTYGPKCPDGPHNQPEHCPDGCNDPVLVQGADNYPQNSGEQQ